MPGWILVLALFVLWPLIRRYFVARSLARWPYVYREYELVREEEVPSHLLAVMRPRIEELEAKGFRVFSHYRNAVSAVPGEFQWLTALFHPQTGCYAIVDMAEDASRIGTVEVGYLTYFSREHALLTTSRPQGVQGDPAGLERVVADFEQLWEIHRSRVETVGSNPDRKVMTFSPEELADVLAASINRHIDSLVAEKRLKPDKLPGIWRMTAAEAWRCSGSALKSIRAANKPVIAPPGQPLPPPVPLPPGHAEARLEHEVDLFLFYRKAGSNQGSNRWEKLIILIISMGLFLFWLGFSLSLQSLAIVFLVLLVHESGHLFGMWLFGYRNLQMLFLPFFGAVAIGSRERAKPWQELIVLLLGPIPGLIAGIALLVAIPFNSMSGWLQETVSILLILNGFNLLPIYPMDGGQLIRLAFFTRFPRIGAAFHLISGVLLAVVGWYTDLWALVFIGVMMLSGTRRNFSGASIVNSVRASLANPPAASERDLAREVLRRAEGPAFVQRYRNSLAPYMALQTPLAGFGTAAVVALLYLSPIWGPLLAWPMLQNAAEKRVERATAELKKVQDEFRASSKELPKELIELRKQLDGEAGEAAMPLLEYADAQFHEGKKPDDDVREAATEALRLPLVQSLLRQIESALSQRSEHHLPLGVFVDASAILVGAALVETDRGNSSQAWKYLVRGWQAEVYAGMQFQENPAMKAFEWFFLTQSWPSDAEIQWGLEMLPDVRAVQKLGIERLVFTREIYVHGLFNREDWGWRGKTPLFDLDKARYIEDTAELYQLRYGGAKDLREMAKRLGDIGISPTAPRTVQEIKTVLTEIYRTELLRAALECYETMSRTGHYPARPPSSEVRTKEGDRYVLQHEHMPELTFRLLVR